MTRKVIPIVLGFVLLAAVAVAGWVRTPAHAAPQLPPNTAWDNCSGSAAPAADTAYTPYDNGPQVHRAYYSQEPAQRTVVERRYVQPRTTTTYVAPRHRGRPLSHSVAIVGGSAGVGAAIGGLAGGGRGAAIGALSGGGLGFLYDRLTHNR